MAKSGNDKIKLAQLRDEIWLETSNAETLVDYEIIDGCSLGEDEISGDEEDEDKITFGTGQRETHS